jgi:archaellum component FlaG (FlaF/FlaG flagellin family)
MKKIFTILVAIFITGSYTLLAQNSVGFDFEKTVHDFGRIKEEGGKVSYTFKFKNTGKNLLSSKMCNLLVVHNP